MKKTIKRTMRSLARRLFRRPCVQGSDEIMGSFPSYSELFRIGSERNYFIHNGYQHRSAQGYFNDLANTNQWQDEVYRFAREVADKHSLRSVVDFGCGSGYKLLKYFGSHKTVGIDVAETCALLRKRHPDRQWALSDFSSSPVSMGRVDLVIASDVIEHLIDPDALLRWILRTAPSFVVLSTPDRNLLRSGTHNGPPLNPMHVREWSMAELHAYIAESFDIVDHFVSSPSQATQCVLARVRTSASPRMTS